MHAIDVTDVTKTYGDVTALDGLSLAVESGATFGLLGTNGAGKSTLFKLIVGHVRPDDGSVAVIGRDVATAGPTIRRTVGYLPEHAGFPPALTGREVLEFHAEMRGLASGDRIADVLALVGLSAAADRAVGGYSNGMTRRLGLATALLSRPTILLLDEPTAGLDPQGVVSFHAIIDRLARDEDLTVVLSSHVLSEIEKLCDTVAILEDGHLRVHGRLDDLERQVSDASCVTLRLAEPDTAEDAQAVATRHGVSVTSARKGVLVLDCPAVAVPTLLADVADAVELAGVEVTEPGLDRVFAQALASPERSEVEGTS